VCSESSTVSTSSFLSTSSHTNLAYKLQVVSVKYLPTPMVAEVVFTGVCLSVSASA